MEVKEIKANIFHVTYPTTQDLMKTFIRFQERYESPKFKDKVFTVKEFSEWYKKDTGSEEFTYFDDWTGTNVPGHIFEAFRDGTFAKVHKLEQELLEKLPNDGRTYYVIGTAENGDLDDLEHEMCHALYYTNKDYLNEVTRLLNEYDTTSVEDYIIKLGYNKSVLHDETHAYISASSNSLIERKIEFDKDLHNKLYELFKKTWRV
tara:strand:+ start:88218 stop:88832 length:615 start_codon:yes stop_codon:yes gene_type:complete